jgi:hypothetical protein
MTGAPRVARQLRLVVALPLLLASSGCATASAAFRSGPAGIPAEWALRDHLTYGRATSAWTAMGDKKIAPADALLRAMYRGVIGLHAGEYTAGSRAMDRAWTLVDDRFSKRVSVGAASLVTSEATLPYYPGITERMFIPYYGALNWLARNELDETAVEARRLSALLAAEGEDQPPAELRGMLRYVSGVLFEAAGERQDAMVAYRNAAALMARLPGDTTFAPRDSGDVVVLIEEGFVGRPEPRSFGVYMNGDELVALTSGNEDARLAVARTLERRRWDNSFDRTQVGWLTYEVNWATFGAPSRIEGQLGARTNPVEFSVAGADVTAAVRRDFERELPAKLSRAIARTAVRWAAARAADRAFSDAVKKGKDDDDDTKGWGSFFLGLGLAAATATSAVIDQPDLRAWQLLPDRLSVARVRLPVGEHPIEVMRGDEVVSLGIVTVRPGGIAVLTHRWWPGPGRTMTQATQGVKVSAR